MKNIEKEIEKMRDARWFKDLSSVYNKLQEITKDEYDTTLEQFLIDYYELKNKLIK